MRRLKEVTKRNAEQTDSEMGLKVMEWDESKASTDIV